MSDSSTRPGPQARPGAEATGAAEARLSPSERAVLDHVTEADVVEATRRLVRCPGVNPPGQEAATAAEFAAMAREFDLTVRVDEVFPERPNVTAILPGGDGPALMLLGHTDVVPLGDEWTRDPFGGELEDGRIYGRGATDMKGGLAACLVAMAALRRAGVALSGPIELLAAVDEEETGHGIRHWVAASGRPDADCSTNDSLLHDRVEQSVERGAVSDVRRYAGCIVAEPTDLQTIVAARGDSYLDIVVTGQAAHAGNPDDGRNAVTGAALIVAELDRWHREFAADRAQWGAVGELVGPPTFNAGTFTGGQGISTVPASARIGLDRRLMPGEDPAAVVAGIRERIEGLGLAERGLSVTVEMTMDMPGFATAADDAFVQLTDGALQAVGGPGLPLGGWSAACDGGHVARETGAPVIVLGPGSVNGQAHRPDESVGVDELVVAARTYALAALRLLSPGD